MKQHWSNVLKFIIPYLLVLGVFEYLTSIILGIDMNTVRPIDLSTIELLTFKFTTSISTALIVWIFVKYVDKRTFKSLGFNNENLLADNKIGLILGFVIMLLGFSYLLITDHIFIKNYRFLGTDLFYNLLIFVFVSFSEELLMRGYVLQNFKASMNQNLALILSSGLFALMHFANPNSSSIGFINLFLAGILLGLCYLLTKNLWLPFALHFSWNFFQGNIFGFNVSGHKRNSIIEIGYQYETIWNGGGFGFEGSVLCIIFQIIAILFLKWLLKTRLLKDNVNELELN